MTKNLVIVESPAKSKTIKKYLGKDFEVLASYGHVRDLVPKEGAVDPDNAYAMKYEVIDKNQRHVDAIIKALKGAEALYLATRRPLSIPPTCPATSSTRSRHAAPSTTSSASTSRRCCGRRSGAGCRPAVCRARRCA